MPEFEDHTGGAVAHADRLFSHNIAIASGSTGPALIRANSVIVPVRGDDPNEVIKRAIDAAAEADIEVRLAPRSDKDQPDIHIAGGHVNLFFDPIEQKHDRDSGKFRAWSTAAVAAVIGALASAGIDAVVNAVFMANNVFLGNPGGYVANGGGYVANPGGYVANATLAAPASAAPQPARRLGLECGQRPTVLVIDTGLQTIPSAEGRVARHGALQQTGVQVHAPWRDEPMVLSPELPVVPDDEDEPDDDPERSDGTGSVDLAAGHGTFIAGLIARICPDVEIHVEGVLTSFGDGDDQSVAAGIERAVERLGRPFDVIAMSLGTYTIDDEPPPAVMTALHEQVHAGTLVVASAGNNNSPRPQYPAADPCVVAVGALDHDSRAPFSNFGPWVDACAPGVDVTSTYLHHIETAEPFRVYEGWATWSGTSFSAPKVAAAILRDQTINGGTATEAWTRLSHWERFRYPDLGVVFNVR